MQVELEYTEFKGIAWRSIMNCRAEHWLYMGFTEQANDLFRKVIADARAEARATA